MLKNRYNVVTDGQWGSCGKGLIATAIADKFRPEIISTTNMANAGHTAVSETGDKFVAKAVPSAAVLTKWREGYQPQIIIGSTAAFTIEQLQTEIQQTGINYALTVHERAGVITDDHKQTEADMKKGTKHLASTMQGCGAFLSDKVMRRRELKLARDYAELAGYMPCHLPKKLEMGMNNSLTGYPLPIMLDKLVRVHDWTILHEGAQGFSLDINHGSHYPQCTSRGTTAVQNLADMGLSPALLGDTYVVIRPFPIRVGNVIEGGKMVGYSGDAYPGQEETSWEKIAEDCGAPPEVMQGELTTVTKRLRRVFTFSKQQLEEAVAVNGATKLALNFANYLDWSCFGKNSYDDLPVKVTDFIRQVEDIAQIPVTIVGTGPQNDHVCFIE
jgi:adenylosuccinate synthase